MNRRDLIKSLIGFGLTAAIDPERLLWVPHSKAIFIPPPTTMQWHVIDAGRTLATSSSIAVWTSVDGQRWVWLHALDQWQKVERVYMHTFDPSQGIIHPPPVDSPLL